MTRREDRRISRRRFSRIITQFEVLETRRLLTNYSVDGSGNNLANPQWGSTDEQLLRLTPSAYADGRSAPAGANRPSARQISNVAMSHPARVEIDNARELSAYAYAWGQFIDHDLDLTNTGSPAEPFNILVPTGDPWFDPDGTGTQTIGFNRSERFGNTGNINPRQQPSDITAFIDGSMIYGSDAVRADALREHVGGRIFTSAGNLLPWNTFGLDNQTLGGPADSWFVAGDVRANENIELTAMHVLFLREHNRLAAEIATQNPTWNDEQIYQRARRLVAAEIQVITYNEFLPALLGPNAILPYQGYRPNVNPTISTEFSTAAFRFGHTMVGDDVEFLDNNGNEVREEIPLAEAFFSPRTVVETGIDPIVKYLASSNAEEVDTKIVDGLRNFLFGPPGAGGFDLASLNIQRGRDHGLNHYNAVRGALGIPPIQNFAQLTSDPVLQQQLQQLYGNVNNMDLYVGGLASDHLPGSSLGVVFQRIIVDQFMRLRDGDRLWWQNDLPAADQQLVANTHLADVIARNSGINNLQGNVFFFDVDISGQVFLDRNNNGVLNLGEPGIAGRTMSLIDNGNGRVVRTAVTDAAGRYTFDDVGLGEWRIGAQALKGWVITSPAQPTLMATRGIIFNNVNFGQIQLFQGPDNPPPQRTTFGSGNNKLIEDKNDLIALV